MAEALAALGALSAAAQLVELTVKISKVVIELRSNTKNGLSSVLDQVDRVTQFVSVAEAIQHGPVQSEQARKLALSCLDDTKRLHKVLLACASSPGDRTGKRFVKAWQWRTRRKEVVELCIGLEERKATLGLAVMEPLSMAGRTIDGGVRQIASNLTEIGKKISDIHARGNCPQPGEQLNTHSSKPHASRGLCNIDLEQMDNFVGREDILTKLSHILAPIKKHTRAALYGLGGIGKSKIALEYAIRLRFQNADLHVFFLQATSQLKLQIDFQKLAEIAGLPSSNTLDERRLDFDSIKYWLSTDDEAEWLVIVDDANEDTLAHSNNVIDHIPRANHGSVIFTTRDKRTALRLATVPQNIIEVGGLDPVSAREMLYTHIGRASTHSGEDNEDATELLASLEHLPLAISLAGSFILYNSTTIPEYHHLLSSSEASKLELLGDQPALTLTFEKITQSDPDAAALLSFMSCLSKDNIPKALLQLSDKDVDELYFLRNMGVLKAYCLVTGHPKHTFSMHGLVHLALRSWLHSQHVFERWIEAALTVLDLHFPSGEPETLMDCEVYIAHAEAVLRDCRIQRESAAAQIELAHRCSLYHQLRGRYRHAEELARKTVSWSTEHHGASHETTLFKRGNLGTTLRYLGQYDDARILDEETARLATEVLGNNHKFTLAARDNLALSLRELGLYSSAEAIHASVLSLRRSTLGPHDAHTLASMNNLTLVLQLQQKYTHAHKLGSETVALKRRVLGSAHLDTLLSITNLGVILQHLNHLDSALSLYREVLAGREKLLGRKHPKTVLAMRNIGSVLHKQAQWVEAEEVMREVWERSCEALGKKHPEAIVSAGYLSIALESLGKYAEEEELCRDAWMVSEGALGAGHPASLWISQRLANCLRDKRKREEKLELEKARVAASTGWRETQICVRELPRDLRQDYRNIEGCGAIYPPP